ncbi:MAG: hypothetical protein IJ164_02735 [Duodenibacillus sp.]|nr:hypothetical protein [Duodenibacillus sp.]
MKSELEEAVKAVTKKLRKSEYLLTASDVALLLGFEPGSESAQIVMAAGSFPESRQFTPNGRKMWRRKDVIEWIDWHYDAIQAAQQSPRQSRGSSVAAS